MLGLTKRYFSVSPNLIIKSLRANRQFYTRFQNLILKPKRDANHFKKFNVSEYKEIYRYPRISLLGNISKLKNMTVIACLLSSSSILILYNKNEFSGLLLAINLSIVAAALIVILVISQLSRNLIGVIYVCRDEKTKKVALSYLNGKGRRVNSIVMSEDLTVVDYNNFFANSSLKKLIVKNAEQELKLYVSRRNVSDFGNFAKVFPNLL